MAVMLGVLLWLVLRCSVPVTLLLSGEVFTQHFDYVWHGVGDSFQVAVNKMFMVAAVLTTVVLPLIVLCRVFTGFRTPFQKQAFLILSLALCLFPLSAFGLTVVALARYILDMGFTVARIKGTACGVIGLTAIILFLYSMVRITPVKPKRSAL